MVKMKLDVNDRDNLVNRIRQTLVEQEPIKAPGGSAVPLNISPAPQYSTLTNTGMENTENFPSDTIPTQRKKKSGKRKIKRTIKRKSCGCK